MNNTNTVRSPDLNTFAMGTRPAERKAKREKKQVEGQLSLYCSPAPDISDYDHLFFDKEPRKVRKGRHIPEGQLLFYDIGVKWATVIQFPTPEGAPREEVSPTPTVAGAAPAARETAAAIDEMIEKNTGLVHYCMKLVGGITSLNRDDVEQAGMMALWRAAKGFDTSRGRKFSSYATIAIKRAMIREVGRSCDRLNPNSWDAIEEDCPSLAGQLATSEAEAFRGENSPVVELMLEVADTLRLLKERKGVKAFAMYLQGYSGAQIAEAIGVSEKSYTAFISTGRKVVRSNPLFLQAAADMWDVTRKHPVVELLEAQFELRYAEDLTFNVPMRWDDAYEARLMQFLAQEKIAEYILNKVRIGEEVLVINRDTGCSTKLNVGTDILEISFAVQICQNPRVRRRRVKKSA